MAPLEPGDLVQCDPDKCRWGPVIVVVTEVRAWGVVGYFLTHNPDGTPGRAYVRVSNDAFARVGRAEWVDADG